MQVVVMKPTPTSAALLLPTTAAAEETEQLHVAGAAAVQSLSRAPSSPPVVVEITGRHKGKRAVCMGVYSLHSDASASSPTYRRDEPPHLYFFRGEGNVWRVSSEQGQGGVGKLRSDRAAAAIEDVLAGGAVRWAFRNAIGRGFTVDPNIRVLATKKSAAVAAATGPSGAPWLAENAQRQQDYEAQAQAHARAAAKRERAAAAVAVEATATEAALATGQQQEAAAEKQQRAAVAAERQPRAPERKRAPAAVAEERRRAERDTNRRKPLHMHSGRWGYSRWRCCYCTDYSSTYCCSSTSSTHIFIKKGWAYEGHGDQTKVASYKSAKRVAIEAAAAEDDALIAADPKAWAAANKERRLPLHQHNKSWSDSDISSWPCCRCTDATSTYCCSPTSPTHACIVQGCKFKGRGDQRKPDSYVLLGPLGHRIGTPEWAAATEERRLPPHKHDKRWFAGPQCWECCYCSDATSVYCCSPTSPTHYYVKNGWTYEGRGSQTVYASYNDPRPRSIGQDT